MNTFFKENASIKISNFARGFKILTLMKVVAYLNIIN